MRKVMIMLLMIAAIGAQAQTNGGELSGRTKTGGRLPVGVDSLAPLRGALLVSDSALKAKIPSGLMVNSNRLAVYSPDSIKVFATNGFGGSTYTLSGKSANGTLLPIGSDSIASNRAALMVADTVVRSYLSSIDGATTLLADNSSTYDPTNAMYLQRISDTTKQNYLLLNDIKSNTSRLPIGMTTVAGKLYTTAFLSTTDSTNLSKSADSNYSRKGIVLLSALPTGNNTIGFISNDSNTLSRRNVQVTNTVTVSGTVTSSDSTTASRKGVVVLNTVPISGTVTSSDSSTASRKGVVLLTNPTIANTTFAATQSGTWTINNDSVAMSRRGVVLLQNPTIANTTFSVTPSGTFSVTATNDSASLSRRNVQVTNTVATSFTRLKASTDTVAISGSITATSGATAIFDSTWSAASLDTTGLGALANSATVGWRTDTVGLRWRKCSDVKIGIKLTMANTAPANDKAVYVYLNPWYTTDGGTTWYSSDQGTTTLPTAARGSSTIASPNDLILLGVLSYTTQNMTLQRSFTLSQAYGSTMPDAFSLVIVNYSGAAVGTTNNIISYQPVNKVQR